MYLSKTKTKNKQAKLVEHGFYNKDYVEVGEGHSNMVVVQVMGETFLGEHFLKQPLNVEFKRKSLRKIF